MRSGKAESSGQSRLIDQLDSGASTTQMTKKMSPKDASENATG
jgi:hypothetical protein